MVHHVVINSLWPLSGLIDPISQLAEIFEYMEFALMESHCQIMGMYIDMFITQLGFVIVAPRLHNKPSDISIMYFL